MQLVTKKNKLPEGESKKPLTCAPNLVKWGESPHLHKDKKFWGESQREPVYLQDCWDASNGLFVSLSNQPVLLGLLHMYAYITFTKGKKLVGICYADPVKATMGQRGGNLLDACSLWRQDDLQELENYQHHVGAPSFSGICSGWHVVPRSQTVNCGAFLPALIKLKWEWCVPLEMLL